MRTSCRALAAPVVILVAVGVGVVIGILATGALVDRAAQPLLEEPDDQPVVVDVVEREFGRDVPVAVRVTWAGRTVGAQVLTGVVTSAPDDSALSVPGEVLLRVGNEPVVVARGDTPAYRNLALGSKGADVRQLQELLASLELLDFEPDGDFGASTARAVRAMNGQLGASFGSEVPLGAVIFLAEGDHRLMSDVVLGQAAPDSLEFTSLDPTGPQVAALVGVIPELREGLAVEVEHLDRPLRVASIDVNDQEAVLRLVSTDGSPPCADASCPLRSLDTLTSIVGGRLELVPTRSGPTVPVAALATGTDGDTAVIDAEGRRHTVTVISTQDGLALIEGLPAEITTVRGDARS